MKHDWKIWVAVILSGLVTWISCHNTPNNSTFDQAVHQWLEAHTDSLEASAGRLLAVASGNDSTALQQAFEDCRKRYKQLEWCSEYYAPATSRLLNGPPLPEIEVAEHQASEPSGLQVIETFLYPYDTASNASLRKEIRSFTASVTALRQVIAHTRFDTAHVFDACKLEVFRVVTLGISGFDTPLSGLAIQESTISLGAVQDLCRLMAAPPALLTTFDNAIAVGHMSVDTNGFDYAGFITGHLNPLTKAMMHWYRQEGLPLVKEQTALKQDAATLFDTAVLNIRHFITSPEAFPTPEKVALGQELFGNTQLAGNGKRSCKSCHQPEKAFTDGLNQSLTISGRSRVLRNAPTMLYAGLQLSQFYDMRSPTLENQVLDVLNNKDEMHSSPVAVASWLNKIPAMQQRFRKAFPQMPDTIRAREVMMAIASYIRELRPFNASFDRYMRGDKQAMDAMAVKGFNLFMGKGRCATCHFIPLFNGTSAPDFSTTESEVLGVLQQPGVPVLDSDLGRFIHTEMEELKYAFKTPTLRNVALTAPYMHNGAYRTLEEVIDFYDKGGGVGYGIHLPNQTLAPDALHLLEAEKQALIAFMGALSDER